MHNVETIYKEYARGDYRFWKYANGARVSLTEADVEREKTYNGAQIVTVKPNKDRK